MRQSEVGMDHQELMELCKENGIDIQKKLFAEIAEKDFLLMTEDDWLKVFVNLGFDNQQTINIRRSAVGRLYDLCISKSLTDYNPMESIKLTSRNVLSAVKNNVYITPEELEQGINKLKNREIGAGILRILYEGVNEIQDLYNLKSRDVDWENRQIHMPEFTLHMSEDLYRAAAAYDETWKMGRFQLVNAYDGSFIKVVSYKTSVDYYSNFINMSSRFISGAGFKKIHLYGSGWINFLYKKCGSVDKMDELFYADDKVRGLISNLCEEIEEYGKEYGLNLEGKYIRFRYKSYYESFKFKMKNNG
jgi:integrase